MFYIFAFALPFVELLPCQDPIALTDFSVLIKEMSPVMKNGFILGN